MDKFKIRIIIQQEQKLDKRSATLGYIRNRAPMQRVTNRPSAGTLKAKQLDKLEQEEDLTRFKERHTKGCYNTAITRYFLIDKLYTLNQLYGKWYRQ